MFDNYVFTKGSCQNIVKNGKTIGFEAETKITYYRGIPLSMVNNVEFEVDGLPIPREMIVVSLDRKEWFTLAEAETAASYKWEYGEPLVVRALVDGGLRRGEHDVTMRLKIWPAYYPMPAGGERTRKVVVE